MNGDRLVCLGLDENGLGAGALDLVCTAVCLPDEIADRLGADARWLRDSKTLTSRRRTALAGLIQAHAIWWRVERVSVAAINAHGIRWANLEGFRRLIMAVEAERYIVDGTLPPRAIAPAKAARIVCLPQADARVPAVSAASIVGKVARDALAADVHATCPHCRPMRFDQNAGYLSPAHIAALRTFGPCPIHHRQVFVATALRHAGPMP